MPHIKYKEGDDRYALMFFPLVGLVIGGIFIGWIWVCSYFNLDKLPLILIGTAIPLVLTGGFHLDGFMDVSDVINSYKSKEEKLKILKDPHIGAFAVIRLAILGLIYIGAFSIIGSIDLYMVIALGFIASRALSAIAVLCFPSAKNEGMLYYESIASGKGYSRMANILIVVLELVVCYACMIIISPMAGVGVMLTTLATFLYYYFRFKRMLGGITGDTSGWFLVMCELVVMLTCAIRCFL